MNFIKLQDGSLLNLDNVCYMYKQYHLAYTTDHREAIYINDEDWLKIENYLFRRQMFS